MLAYWTHSYPEVVNVNVSLFGPIHTLEVVNVSLFGPIHTLEVAYIN